jgi:hypothetical protein
MLSNLIYISTRNTNCTEEEIGKILAACERNNGKMNITGVLLYSDKSFLQYLEGEYKEIIALYDKIKLDSRHKNAILIASAPIQEKVFPSWQMGAKKFESSSISFKTEISTEDRKIFEEILAGKNQETKTAVNLIKKFFK